VLNFHRVWFVFGAVEFELPVCAKSWRHIGHESAIDCASEKLSREKAVIKNSVINAKQAIVLPFISFFSFSTQAEQ
jgi:hypothetical protein